MAIISGGKGLRKQESTPFVVNGDMAVAQRGTSQTGIGDGDSGYHTIDRFKFEEGNSPSAVWTMTQESLTSGNAYAAGFTKALKMDVTTSDDVSGHGDILNVICYHSERQDAHRWLKGTSSAEKFTLAFWIKATKTGTHTCELRDNANDRAVSASYTISSSNTWEHKVVTFPADTTGAIGTGNTKGLSIYWCLMHGGNYGSSSLQTSWGSSSTAARYTGQVNNADSTSNNWHLTGVQLEVGEYDATTIPPFQHERFAENLARCHRYCYVMGASANAEDLGQFTVGSGLCRSSGSAIFTDIIGSYPQPLRTEPTLTQVGGDLTDVFCYKNNGTSANPTSISVNRNTIALRLGNNMGTSSGLTAGDATVQQIVEADTDLVFDAEL